MAYKYEPLRRLETNRFNKDKLKGHYEVLNEWDLETELFLWEPETLALMRLEGCTELEYRTAANKLLEFGYFEIKLVPYKENPNMKVRVTGIGANTDMIEYDDSYSVVSHLPFDQTFAKRYYTFNDLSFELEDLDESGLFFIKDNIYEEGAISLTPNNDATIKSSQFSINKVIKVQGENESNFRSINFYRFQYSDVELLKQTDLIQIDFGDPQLLKAVGHIELKDNLNSPLDKNIVWSTVNRGNTYSSNGGMTFQPQELSKIYDNPVGATGDIYLLKDTFDNQNVCWEPHFLVPSIAGNQIWWQAPWVWEFWYSWEQANGEYKMAFFSSGLINWTWAAWFKFEDRSYDNKPGDGDVFNSSLYPSGRIGYMENNNTELGDNSIEHSNFYNQFGVELGLPAGLSSHASTYLQSSDQDSGLLGIGVKFTNTGFNGIRDNNQKGHWKKHATIFTLDYATNATGVLVESDYNSYLSEPVYGKYLETEAYRDLIQGVVDGRPVYNGVGFMSSIGIHTEVKDKKFDRDMRKWSESEDWHMLLLPVSVTQLAGVNTTENSHRHDTNNVYDGESGQSAQQSVSGNPHKKSGDKGFMANLPLIGPKSPRTDSGTLDFRSDSMTVNDPIGYSSIPIDKDWFINKKIEMFKDQRSHHLPLKVNRASSVKDFPSSIDINYYGGDEITIRWLTHDGNNEYRVTKEFKVATEIAQGRTLSGGTRFTML